MKNKLLKGFTVLEALISLMLMSIIITITYTLFNLIGKQLSLFEVENSAVLEYNLFNIALIGDIEKSNDYNIINDQLKLKNYDETEINYFIKKKYVLRQNKVSIDTFKLKIINYEFVNNEASESINKTLKIKLNVLNDTITTHYVLNKDNSEIINTMYFNED